VNDMGHPEPQPKKPVAATLEIIIEYNDLPDMEDIELILDEARGNGVMEARGRGVLVKAELRVHKDIVKKFL
jgi:hypothetical protein